MVEPRTALAPGTPASASVSNPVTLASTSGAAWPIHSATRPICGSAEVRHDVARQSAARQIAADRRAPARRRSPRAGGARTTRRAAPSRWPAGAALGLASPRQRALASASRKNVARAATRSLLRSPSSTTANPCLRNVSPIWIGPLLEAVRAVGHQHVGALGRWHDRRRRDGQHLARPRRQLQPADLDPGARGVACPTGAPKAQARRSSNPSRRRPPVRRRTRQARGAGSGEVRARPRPARRSRRRRTAATTVPSALDRRRTAQLARRDQQRALAHEVDDVVPPDVLDGREVGRLGGVGPRQRRGRAPTARAPSGRSGTTRAPARTSACIGQTKRAAAAPVGRAWRRDRRGRCLPIRGQEQQATATATDEPRSSNGRRHWRPPMLLGDEHRPHELVVLVVEDVAVLDVARARWSDRTGTGSVPALRAVRPRCPAAPSGRRCG